MSSTCYGIGKTSIFLSSSTASTCNEAIDGERKELSYWLTLVSLGMWLWALLQILALTGARGWHRQSPTVTKMLPSLVESR